MRSALALIRASWRGAKTYRLRLVLSFVSLAVSIIPLYFVATALQPTMERAIAAEGGHYFSFLVVGMATFVILPTFLTALPNELGSGISTGVLEVLFHTPARLPSVLLGLIGFNLLWSLLRAAFLLIAGWLLGAQIQWTHIATAAMIIALVSVAYLCLGLIAGACVVAFRTPGLLPQGVLALSALLGGVYYPVSVIPSWIQHLSGLLPVTYGLRALRATLLEGQGITAVAHDLLALVGFIMTLFAIGAAAFLSAIYYARREGTLSQY